MRILVQKPLLAHIAVHLNFGVITPPNRQRCPVNSATKVHTFPFERGPSSIVRSGLVSWGVQERGEGKELKCWENFATNRTCPTETSIL